MWPVIRTILILVLLGAVCLFAAFWITIFLVPLWRWLEAGYGIEAIGHSGPAEWAFWLVWVLLLLPVLAVYRRRVVRRRKPDAG